MEKSTVTNSMCKDLQVLFVTVDFFRLQSTFSVYSRPFLQALFVTVDFFHLQSTFFTGTDSYSRLFVTVSAVHLPHFVQCITILIH